MRNLAARSATQAAHSGCRCRTRRPRFTACLRIARRYFWLVLVCVLLGLAYAGYQNAHSVATYTAVANIQLTADSASRLRIDPTGGGDSGYVDTSRLDTEIEILRSSTLALETIHSLNLDKNSDFAAPPPGRAWDLSNQLDRHALIDTFTGRPCCFPFRPHGNPANSLYVAQPQAGSTDLQ